MAPILLALSLLLQFLVILPTISGWPVSDAADTFDFLLSRDLISAIQGSLKSTAAASVLRQQINKYSRAIDEVAGLGSDLPVSKRAAAACKIADLIFPGRVFAANDPEYQSEEDFNWSQTCWLPAACFIQLRTTADVAAALKVIRHVGTKFAVRSGGHNPNSGFGSIGDSGVLLDLHGLDTLSLSDDGILHAGPGITWGKAYDFLDPHGITVIGGRHYTVGLPGFLLGGGMTFFPNLYGLGTDSVKSYEVVLANSTIIDANAHENADLWRALKGGGSNFGIVTRFDIETHPLHNVQYSLNLYDPSDYVNILYATTQVQKAMETDSNIGFFLNVNPTVIIAGLLYADWPTVPPSAFNAFDSLKSFWGPFIPTTNGTIATLTSAINIGDFPAKREPYAASTKVDHALYVDVHERYLELLKTDMPSANLSYTIQPVAKAAVQAGEYRGGNSLGLEKVSQSWWAPLVEWFDDSTDIAAHKALNDLGNSVQSFAQKRGKALNYQFMNDGSYTQKILDSYGTRQVDTLKKVAKKYDPTGVFQTLQNDGFLLRRL
ncbi:FAD-binding domain-containing protein [Lindgomyces ingoldianus]|uniref:FAD-binding domain-containing protein n=1 Tax=Lindgomyces ingoldianus TaxID=673940 RepID=A0ACB6RF11_9PLEO|nr:FAD-binding domain-containing protein [Lindgomyces ingoldianus]KAF2477645.1 FAD-binding domain-containing protein [Lindgomyces ingoldianus]